MAVTTGKVQIQIKLQGEDQASKAIKSAGDSLKTLNVNVEQGSQGFLGLGKGLAGTVAKFGAVGLAAGVAFDQIKRVGESITQAAANRDQIEILRRDVAGFNDILAETKDKTANMISEADIAQSAAMFKAFGLDMKAFPSLMGEAAKAAVRLGQPIDRMVESMATGIARQSVPILDNLGIVLKKSEISAARVAEELAKANENVNLGESGSASIARLGAMWDDFADSVAGVGADLFVGLVDLVVPVEKTRVATDGLAASMRQIRAETVSTIQTATTVQGLEQQRADAIARSEAVTAELVRTTQAYPHLMARAFHTSEELAEELRIIEGLERLITEAKQAHEAATLREREAAALAHGEAVGRSLVEWQTFGALEAQLSEAQGIDSVQRAIRQTAAQIAELRKQEVVDLGKVNALMLTQVTLTRLAAINAEHFSDKKPKGGGGGRRTPEQVSAADLLELEKARIQAQQDLTTEQKIRLAEIDKEIAMARLASALDDKRITSAKRTADALTVEAKFRGQKAKLIQAEIDGINKAAAAELKREADRQKAEASRRSSVRQGFGLDQEDRLATIGEAAGRGDITAAEAQQLRADELAERAKVAADKEQEALDARIAKWQELSAVTQEAAGAMTGSQDEATAALGRMLEATDAQIAALAQGGATAGVAAGKIAAAAIKNERAKAAVLGAVELAAGFATLFTNPAESAAHFVAAGLYAAVAGGAKGKGGGGGKGASGGRAVEGGQGRDGSRAIERPEDRAAQAPMIVNINAPVVGGTPQEVGATLAKFQRSAAGTGMAEA